MIYDSEGNVIDESSHEFTELSPADSLVAEYLWGTSDALEGVYRVVCYALYGGGSTSPVIEFFGADDDPPTISPINPLQGHTIRSTAYLQARVNDRSEVTDVTFSIRATFEGQEGSIDQRLESMQAQSIGDGIWQLPYNTTQIPDGNYSLVINAVDASGNIGEETVHFSVINAPVLNIITQEPGVRLTVNDEEHQTNSYGYISITTQQTSYTLEAQPIVEYSGGSRALFTEWEDGTTSNPRTITVSSDTTIMARYRTQHLLTIESAHGNPVGGGWYDEGSEATISVSSPLELIPQYVFTGWRGDADAVTPNSKIIMDGPKTIEAAWDTDYTISYATLCVLAVTGLAVLIRYIRK